MMPLTARAAHLFAFGACSATVNIELISRSAAHHIYATGINRAYKSDENSLIYWHALEEASARNPRLVLGAGAYEAIYPADGAYPRTLINPVQIVDFCTARHDFAWINSVVRPPSAATLEGGLRGIGDKMNLIGNCEAVN
jgi:hypothetical protein